MDFCGAGHYCPSSTNDGATDDTQVRRFVVDVDPCVTTPIRTDSRLGGIIMGASPSPLTLNPLEGDWRSGRSTSSSIRPSLKLSLSDDTPTTLKTGVSLVLLWRAGGDDDDDDDGGRYNVHQRFDSLLQFDSSNKMLNITIQPLSPMEEQKSSKDNNNETCFAPNEILQIPLSSLAQVTSSSSSEGGPSATFLLKLKRPIRDGTQKVYLECQSRSQQQQVVSSLQQLIHKKRGLLPKRTSPSSTSDSSSRRTQQRTPEQLMMERIIQVSSTTTITQRTNNNDDGDEGTELALLESPPRQKRLPSLWEQDDLSSAGAEIGSPERQQKQTDMSSTDLAIEQSLIGTCLQDFEIPIRRNNNNNTVSPRPSSHNAPPISPLRGAWCGAADDVIQCSVGVTNVAAAFGELFGEESREKEIIPTTTTTQKQQQDMSANTTAVLHDLEQPAAVACLDVSFFSNKDRYCTGLGEVDGQKVKSPSPNRSQPPGKIRNRSENSQKRMHRWKELQNTMTFAAASQDTLMHHVQTTKSMDEADFRATDENYSTLWFLDGVFSSSNRAAAGGGNLLDQQRDDEILYYDSDPGDFREPNNRRCSRQIAADKFNQCDQKSALPQQLRFPRHVLKASALNDSDIKIVVDIMKTFKLTLLWHPNPSQDSPLPTPTCVTAWIERGTYLMNQTFVQPKFMYKIAHEAQLSSGSRKLNVKHHRFDLLEICKVDASPHIDRAAFPLAQRARCFSIRTKNDFHLFQAQSRTEKAHICFGLKLVVARLASLLMVRDMTAVDEFFEPVTDRVPGEAPEWTIRRS